MSTSPNPDLNTLGDLIRKNEDDFRQKFVDDPAQAMQGKVANPGNIPSKILDALKAFSKPELDCLGDLSQAFHEVTHSTTPGDGTADAQSGLRMV